MFVLRRAGAPPRGCASTPTACSEGLSCVDGICQAGFSIVSGAAYGVGYNSLSQFSREFTRTFGANPSAYLPRT